MDTSKKSGLVYFSIFLVRRLLVCAVVVLVREDQVIPLSFIMYLSILTMAYLLHCSPFYDKPTNNLELFNEFILWTLCYCYLPFTLYSELELDKKRGLGYFIVAYTIGYILINILVILFYTLKKLWSLFKKPILKFL